MLLRQDYRVTGGVGNWSFGKTSASTEHTIDFHLGMVITTGFYFAGDLGLRFEAADFGGEAFGLGLLDPHFFGFTQFNHGDATELSLFFWFTAVADKTEDPARPAEQLRLRREACGIQELVGGWSGVVGRSNKVVGAGQLRAVAYRFDFFRPGFFVLSKKGRPV